MWERWCGVSGFNSDMASATIDLGISILAGGNTDVQRVSLFPQSKTRTHTVTCAHKVPTHNDTSPLHLDRHWFYIYIDVIWHANDVLVENAEPIERQEGRWFLHVCGWTDAAMQVSVIVPTSNRLSSSQPGTCVQRSCCTVCCRSVKSFFPLHCVWLYITVVNYAIRHVATTATESNANEHTTDTYFRTGWV